MRLVMTPWMLSGRGTASQSTPGAGGSAVVDLDQAKVAEGVGQFLAEERVAIRLMPEQGGHGWRQGIDAQAVAGQCDDIVRPQRRQRDAFGAG